MNSLSWWLWSILLAAAAIRAGTLCIGFLLILIFTLFVAKHKKSDEWGNPFKLTIQLALAATVVRLFFAILIGTPLPGKTLISLPQLELPNWLAGIRVGGDVTRERLISVINESSKFAVVLIAFGAASALSSPVQVIKLISGRIYLFGVTLIIAVSVLPQIVNSFNRVQSARRMRGLTKLRLNNFRNIITPVLEESIERAIDLSAAMESRGFGYSKNPTRYRPEKFTLSDLLIFTSSIYLLIFTPVLINSFGALLATTLFGIFALSPLFLIRKQVVLA